MVVFVTIIVAAIAALAVIGFIAMRARGAGRPAVERAAVADDLPTGGHLRPQVAEFHVRGDEAIVQFEVPLPAGEVDPVLAELLSHEAIEVVREKRHELPISQVERVRVMGRRNGEWAQVGSVALDVPGELPPPVLPEHLVHAAKVSFDPIGSFAETRLSAAPGLAERVEEHEIGPAGRELQIVAGLEAALRAQGIDPSVMSAGDLVLGVLRMTGHQVTPAGGGLFDVGKAGTRTYLRVVDHQSGEYPELSEQVVREFCAGFESSGAQRGLLVTDKYSPFMVYERERRQPKLRFLSRERLQDFVDAVAVS